MPNGQLVEFYAPMKELNAKPVKGPNHLLFETWRVRDISKLTDAEKHEYKRDVATSYRRYQAAWNAALRRLGYADASAARASWMRVEARLASLQRRNSEASSSAVGATQAPGLSNVQTPDGDLRANPFSVTAEGQRITVPSSSEIETGSRSLTAQNLTDLGEKRQSLGAARVREAHRAEIEAAALREAKAFPGGPRIVVAEHGELPESVENERGESVPLRSVAPDDGSIEGFYYRGTVYLLPENISTPARARTVYRHEAAHWALRTTLADAGGDESAVLRDGGPDAGAARQAKRHAAYRAGARSRATAPHSARAPAPRRTRKASTRRIVTDRDRKLLADMRPSRYGPRPRHTATRIEYSGPPHFSAK